MSNPVPFNGNQNYSEATKSAISDYHQRLQQSGEHILAGDTLAAKMLLSARMLSEGHSDHDIAQALKTTVADARSCIKALDQGFMELARTDADVERGKMLARFESYRDNALEDYRRSKRKQIVGQDGEVVTIECPGDPRHQLAAMKADETIANIRGFTAPTKLRLELQQQANKDDVVARLLAKLPSVPEKQGKE